jgi:hypothetical protein
MASEVYDDAKAAFIELRDLIGVEIIFASRLQLCVSGTIHKKTTWQEVGSVEEIQVQIDMLDDDFEDFVLSGINDSDSIVELDGLLFQVIGINTNPALPVVHLILTKDK